MTQMLQYYDIFFCKILCSANRQGEQQRRAQPRHRQRRAQPRHRDRRTQPPHSLPLSIYHSLPLSVYDSLTSAARSSPPSGRRRPGKPMSSSRYPIVAPELQRLQILLSPPISFSINLSLLITHGRPPPTLSKKSNRPPTVLGVARAPPRRAQPRPEACRA